MLDNAIEVTLKGELERIHKILIADPKELGDFKTLQSLLRDDFAKHPSAGTLHISKFEDIEKTIRFDTAFDRVAQLYPGLSDAWKQRLIPSRGEKQPSLHSLRNDIVHYGGDSESITSYMVAIIDIAFPFLAELFKLITNDSVRLSHLMTECIYREVEVTRAVLRDLRNEKAVEELYAIKTLQHQILWTSVDRPGPLDDLDMITWSGETDWEKFADRQKKRLFKTWDEGLTIEIQCPVCHSQSADGSFLQAQVLLDGDKVEHNELIPEGFHCSVCGLHIEPRERFLARHFVGQISEDIRISYLKDIGNID
jgi:hypothetical protein